MSRLRLANGDDHPEAAGKHLGDAHALLGASRNDGAAYLAGYVAECSLKALLLHEKGTPPAGAPPLWKKGQDGHDLAKLQSDAATLAVVAGAKTARYFGPAVRGLTSLALAAWDPEMRYRAPSMAATDATSWLANAESVYHETVWTMIKDGVL